MWKAPEKPIKEDVEKARRRAEKALSAMTNEEDAAITAAANTDSDAQLVDDLFRRKAARLKS